MIATANIIRLLRNSVAGVPQNQFLQVKTGLLDTLMDCTCFYYSVTEKCHREKHKYPYAMVYSPVSVQVTFNVLLAQRFNWKNLSQLR